MITEERLGRFVATTTSIKLDRDWTQLDAPGLDSIVYRRGAACVHAYHHSISTRMLNEYILHTNVAAAFLDGRNDADPRLRGWKLRVNPIIGSVRIDHGEGLRTHGTISKYIAGTRGDSPQAPQWAERELEDLLEEFTGVRTNEIGARNLKYQSGDSPALIITDLAAEIPAMLRWSRACKG